MADKEQTPEEKIASAAAAVITSLSEKNLKNHNGTGGVTIPRYKIEALHEAIEALYPGWIAAIYAADREEAEA